MSKVKIKEHFFGALELFLFMRSGIKAFDNDHSAMIRSFIIPALLYPMSIIYPVLDPPENMKTISPEIIALYAALFFPLSMMAYIGCVTMIARYAKVDNDLNKFITAWNWMGVPAFLIGAPFVVADVMNVISEDTIWRILALITTYCYVSVCYLGVRAFKMPWQLGAFVGVMAIICDDIVVKLLSTALGIPLSID